MKSLRDIIRRIDAKNCDNEHTLSRLRFELEGAVRAHIRELQEAVRSLRANSEYFSDRNSEGAWTLRVLPSDIERLEELS